MGQRREIFARKRNPTILIKKKIKIFLIYKVIQNGAVAKSYMRKGFLIYEEMRKYLTIYEEAQFRIIDRMTQDQTLPGTE
jgi:hypothetical protein